VRREFIELAKGKAAPIATETLQRIAALYAIEAELRGKPPELRRAVRQQRKRGDEAVLPARVVNVLSEPGAGGFGLTLWIALTTTRRASGIAGSRF